MIRTSDSVIGRQTPLRLEQALKVEKINLGKGDEGALCEENDGFLSERCDDKELPPRREAHASFRKKF